MSYDPKCYDLAEHFLPNSAPERLKHGLAQAIQDAVEDYCVGEAVNLRAALQELRATPQVCGGCGAAPAADGMVVHDPMCPVLF